MLQAQLGSAPAIPFVRLALALDSHSSRTLARDRWRVYSGLSQYLLGPFDDSIPVSDCLHVACGLESRHGR
jgi:hypothetical protein